MAAGFPPWQIPQGLAAPSGVHCIKCNFQIGDLVNCTFEGRADIPSADIPSVDLTGQARTMVFFVV